MDFARKQLEKYGWTDGKGLGKNENGISEALKPKLKRSVAGIGHDAAADFTEHWWKQLYDKAASNVQVEEKNGKTKKIKTKDDQFKITNSTYHLTKKGDSKDKEEYDFFIKSAVLNGSEVQNVRESTSDGEENRDMFKISDEELFAACEGRTAHKGARHGLKATGKLARIERQEQLLLSQPKYSGYSHAKKIKKQNLSQQDSVVEDMNLNNDEDLVQIKKKKKKKRKRCFSNENNEQNCVAECVVDPLPQDVEMAGNSDGPAIKSKKNKSKVNNDDQGESIEIPKRKRVAEVNDEIFMETETSPSKDKKRKKKKQKE